MDERVSHVVKVQVLQMETTCSGSEIVSSTNVEYNVTT